MVSLDKLMSFVEGNPNYSLNEFNNKVELTFTAPPISEAAEEDVEGENAVVRVVFAKVGQELLVEQAWIEVGGDRRPMDPRQLEPWLDYISQS
ncbi:hypothetical protein [Sulfodiicoccus acidiphilus]|nr:hypothetical protein [Sulfodiicoccus acidiphilus]